MTGPIRIDCGDAPLIVAFPHGGTELAGLDHEFVSPWLARHDADWWIEDLYAFVRELGATTVATDISRSVIDVNRDPSGESLYPGMATTELCPTTTFDGIPLYRGNGPDAAEVGRRLREFFIPYHDALAAEIARLKSSHPRLVVFDAHSIRSHVPRLFEGELPQFNLGTNGGATCSGSLQQTLESLCANSGRSWVSNGRFRGGWTTRHYGNPSDGVHAVQMELSQRGYMDEPTPRTDVNWPSVRHENPEILPTLRSFISACLVFAQGSSQ